MGSAGLQQTSLAGPNPCPSSATSTPHPPPQTQPQPWPTDIKLNIYQYLQYLLTRAHTWGTGWAIFLDRVAVGAFIRTNFSACRSTVNSYARRGGEPDSLCFDREPPAQTAEMSASDSLRNKRRRPTTTRPRELKRGRHVSHGIWSRG